MAFGNPGEGADRCQRQFILCPGRWISSILSLNNPSEVLSSVLHLSQRKEEVLDKFVILYLGANPFSMISAKY